MYHPVFVEDEAHAVSVYIIVTKFEEFEVLGCWWRIELVPDEQ